MNEPTAGRDPFEVVAESFLARYRSGERPSIEEFVTRYPELADQIRELLPALVMVEQDLSIDPDPNGEESPIPSPAKERRLGDYRILREIGRGGMGVVYEAEQVSLGRQVALKVLPSQVAEDRQALERFRREAKLVARLHLTNILPVCEVGQEDVSLSMPCSSSRVRASTPSSRSRVRSWTGPARGPGPKRCRSASRSGRALAHCRQGAGTRTLGETVEISRQLQYILTG